jgi:hypothetical protein
MDLPTEQNDVQRLVTNESLNASTQWTCKQNILFASLLFRFSWDHWYVALFDLVALIGRMLGKYSASVYRKLPTFLVDDVNVCSDGLVMETLTSSELLVSMGLKQAQ